MEENSFYQAGLHARPLRGTRPVNTFNQFRPDRPAPQPPQTSEPTWPQSQRQSPPQQQHQPRHQAQISDPFADQQGQPYWTSSHETSRSPSAMSSLSEISESSKRPFKSYRLQGAYEKPWLSDPQMKKTRLNNWIIMGFLGVGFALAAAVIVLMVLPYRQADYCLVLEDHFSKLDENVWTHEVQLDGFGTGSFDWTTTDEKNSYVDAAGLHIVPTLTNETTGITNDQLFDGYLLNLTNAKDGACTGTSLSSCVAFSNGTQASMIPPVRSARLSTKGKASIRYGRVEVVAKLPKGDWLWPAIWMMPEDSVYGEWPRSGEMDIMESRGNNWDYPAGGNDWYAGTLHWGPTPASDSFWRSTSAKTIKRSDYTKGFHTYGMEWTDKYIYFYRDSRLAQIMYYSFDPKKDLWDRGEFAKYNENSTLLTDPWAGTASTTGNAPFDQKFFLILNVAVGAKNGWFPDNQGGKPWLDFATNAQWTFYSQADKWLPTWGEGDSRGMTVKSVKMWQQGRCGSSDL